MDLEDEKQPFEFMAEEQSLLRKRPAAPAGRASGGAKAKAAKSRKGTLDGFVTRGAPADEEDDFDDDDDDDDDGLGFNFGAHKTPPVAAAKLSSVFDAPKESKHEVRQLVTGSNGRWRGKLVPAGWAPRKYKTTAKPDGYWVFSHPLHGEVNSLEAIAKKEKGLSGRSEGKSSSSSGDGWVKKKRLGGGPAGDVNADSEEDDFVDGASRAGARASADASAVVSVQDDPLSALLNSKKQRDADRAAMKERVAEELNEKMDTGITVNHALQAAVAARR